MTNKYEDYFHIHGNLSDKLREQLQDDIAMIEMFASEIENAFTSNRAKLDSCKEVIDSDTDEMFYKLAHDSNDKNLIKCADSFAQLSELYSEFDDIIISATEEI